MSIRTSLALVLCLVLSTSARGEKSPEELEAKLKEVERERDALKQKVAMLQLEIMKLKESGGKPAADPAKTGDTAAAADTDASKKPNQWKAKLVSSSPIEANDIKSRIFAQERVISRLNFDLTRAKNDLSSAEFTARNFIEPGEKTGLQAKRAAVTKIELQLKTERAKLAEMREEEADSGKVFHVIFEEVGSGKVVTLLAKGAIVASLDALEVGKTYQVEGRRRDAETILLTKISVENPPPAPAK